MSETTICLKQYISEEDFIKLQELMNICLENEPMYLKLELDYKLTVSRMHRGEPLCFVNEFLCFCGENVIGYIGICNFGGESAELTGMVHPSHRRKGIFTRLYNLAKEECRRQGFNKLLLICDNKSYSGQQFIRTTGARYSFSEYEMKMLNNYTEEKSKNITLRKALNSDVEEIENQNRIFFGVKGRTVIMPEEDEKKGRITYMIEFRSKIIGKIRIEFDNKEGFISGFGILPEYRSKGYGREAIREALRLLSERGIHKAALEVAAENKNALNLYKSCGFEEQSVMDYFEDK